MCASWSPGFFGNYTVDVPMATYEPKHWNTGEDEDNEEIARVNRTMSCPTSTTGSCKEQELGLKEDKQTKIRTLLETR